MLPGVDLRVRADAGGYVQHLVVKDAQAAGRLTSIRYPVTTTGVTLKAAKDGGVLALDLVIDPDWESSTPPGTSCS
ncbi:hypothetical protein [Nonomuraea endophytica]|uniref:hypothetical protein n=1 Tax=Nonomuraea endophytica TaxID=714136 RepID=UPI0037C737DC